MTGHEGTGAPGALERIVRRIDRFQQGHRAPGLIFGVIKKFGDDRAGSLAALITYYGFLAVFPLLLFLTTILGYLVGSGSSVRNDITNSALRDFPIIGTQLKSQIGSHTLHGSGLALAVGLVGLLWGALGVTQIAQYAMAQVWNIPGRDRPNFVTRLARGLLLFGVLGAATAGSTVLASVPTFGAASGVAKVLGALGSVA